jgi:hypothetical protein
MWTASTKFSSSSPGESRSAFIEEAGKKCQEDLILVLLLLRYLRVIKDQNTIVT